MPAKKRTSRTKAIGAAPKRGRLGRSQAPAANDSTKSPVDAFLREVKHPLKPAIESIRRIILGVSAEIHEGIKWNAPSFYTTEHFATFNLARAKDHVMLILHAGAKPRRLKLKRLIAEPTGLIKWLADDRCLVTFESLQDVETKRLALSAVIREWIRHI